MLREVDGLISDCTTCTHARLVTSEDGEKLYFTHCASGKVHVAWLRRDPARMREKPKETFNLRAAWGICRGNVAYWERRSFDTPVQRIPVKA